MYPFVDRVFYMSNFVTITKKEEVEWLEIQSTLRDHIQRFLESGKLNVKDLITDIVDLEDSVQVFEDKKYRRSGKVLIKLSK